MKLDAEKRENGGERHLERTLRAESALATAKREHEELALELRQERDAARAACRALEAKLAGVDLSKITPGGADDYEVRSTHWFPYDRVGVVNAVP